MLNKNFARAVEGVPKPPCEMGGGCEHYERCAKEKLACRDFLAYCKEVPKLRVSVIRNPTRAMYMKVFPSDELAQHGGD